MVRQWPIHIDRVCDLVLINAMLLLQFRQLMTSVHKTVLEKRQLLANKGSVALRQSLRVAPAQKVTVSGRYFWNVSVEWLLESLTSIDQFNTVLSNSSN